MKSIRFRYDKSKLMAEMADFKPSKAQIDAIESAHNHYLLYGPKKQNKMKAYIKSLSYSYNDIATEQSELVETKVEFRIHITPLSYVDGVAHLEGEVSRKRAKKEIKKHWMY